MRFSRSLLLFSYGLFSIAAQTLLFREFVTTFEGNDISIGIFFGSWFLWVGLGALLVYKSDSLARRMLQNIELLFLAYIPAFVLQAILILQAREIAGIESYTLWSVWAMLFSAVIINAPVSFITGLLFPTACRWMASDSAEANKEFAVSGVYILEAAGSFSGGLGVTILLAFGMSLVRIFFILVFILSSSVFAEMLAVIRLRHKSRNKTAWILKTTCGLSFFIPLIVCLGLVFHIDGALLDYSRVLKWTKLLPKDSLSGSFQTAQAEYLYGMYHDQWIAVRDGGVVEALPDESSAGQMAAISLSQKPDAQEVLVIGSGLGLCSRLLDLPQLKGVTWSHCDSEYVRKINRYIPAELRITDPRFSALTDDIRSYLAGEPRLFDIVILNLPDVTNSVLNRYYTLEFYRLIKTALRPNGILAVRITGGENIMGTELVNLGASTKLTLEKVFSHLVLTPGEDMWFIASDSQELTDNPVTLRDRFGAIDGANKILPPQALLSIYLPQRAEKALRSYSLKDLPEGLLINRDARPLAHLYSLLLTAKQSGAPIARFIKILALAGPLVFFIPLIVFVVLRILYIRFFVNQGPGIESRETSFDSSFLVFSAGWIGIGVVIVLMYMYQTRFGSLYLHIGIVSSLFMVGLTIGAAFISYLAKRLSHLVSGVSLYTPFLFAVICVQTIILAAIALWQVEQSDRTAVSVNFFREPTHLIFAVAFFLSGLCSGCYFPLAAGQLAQIGIEPGPAGGKLETADHIGASAGAVVTSLVLVPVLGTRATLWVFAALILANVPPVVAKMFKGEKIPTVAGVLESRRFGYVLFGVATTIIICSNLLVQAGARLKPALPQHVAQTLAGPLELVEGSTTFADTGRKMRYFEVKEDDGKIAGYIFSSQELAPEVRGFGGKINLAVYVDPAGRLIDFNIISSNETPSYLELLAKWCDFLKGHLLFGSDAFADVDAVSGATISSNAIVSALQTSGSRFAGQVLGMSLEPQAEEKTKWAKYLPDTNGIYLIAAFVLSLIVIYRGGYRSRIAVLVLNFILGGIWLNAQYSTDQMASLLSLHTPWPGLSGVFLLACGILLVVVLFGNIYCGYICPFGAIQELLGYLVPGRFKKPLARETMRKARLIKYVVLVVMISVFFISRDRATLAADPLISVFSFRLINGPFKLVILLIVAAALVGSVFYTRFWCRYLCPAGAFLSLLNKVVILKRFLPVKRFGKCEFGLTPTDQMDCIYCDRCRYEAGTVTAKKRVSIAQDAPAKSWNRYFLIAAVVTAGFVSAVSVNRFLQEISVGFDQVVTSAPSGGQPRDVDAQRIRTMIQQKKLSDKEAEFYKKLD
jgi:predicted membrane-bound spermidine synthase/Na+-translocating ferredoxin:NAD+ oxidoreductase RnfG subunit